MVKSTCAMAKNKNPDENLCWRGCGVRGHSSIAGGSAFLRKLGNNLPQDPVILLLGIYPNDAQSYHEDICSTMFIAALFVITKTWKQPTYPSTKEMIKKMWYIYTMEFYTTEKK